MARVREVEQELRDVRAQCGTEVQTARDKCTQQGAATAAAEERLRQLELETTKTCHDLEAALIDLRAHTVRDAMFGGGCFGFFIFTFTFYLLKKLALTW
jgi:hypothetical protein